MIVFAKFVLSALPIFQPAAQIACAAQFSPQNQDSTGAPLAPPSGGTPEPTTLLLLAGGALGYGAVRYARRNKDADRPSS